MSTGIRQSLVLCLGVAEGVQDLDSVGDDFRVCPRIPRLLGSTADTCTCVSLQRYLENPDFPREGGLRILRSLLAEFTARALGSFLRPCPQEQGRGHG